MNSNYALMWSEPPYGNSISESTVIAEDCDIRGSYFGQHTRLKRMVEFKNSRLGDYSYVASFSVVNASDIGNFCSVAHLAAIGLWEHDQKITTHSFHLFESSGHFVKGYVDYEKDHIRTLIGNDVWIGTQAVVLKGVTIGNGAIIGAGSVVTRNVPPYAVVAGTPARIIRYRFKPDEIDYLLQSQWWDFSREQLQILVDTGAMQNMGKFKEVVDKMRGNI